MAFKIKKTLSYNLLWLAFYGQISDDKISAPNKNVGKRKKYSLHFEL
jgi:hypothetical protein